MSCPFRGGAQGDVPRGNRRGSLVPWRMLCAFVCVRARARVCVCMRVCRRCMAGDSAFATGKSSRGVSGKRTGAYWRPSSSKEFVKATTELRSFGPSQPVPCAQGLH
eukprot:5927648-Pleurochrysis_carterae.AAC.1